MDLTILGNVVLEALRVVLQAYCSFKQQASDIGFRLVALSSNKPRASVRGTNDMLQLSDGPLILIYITLRIA